MWPSLPFAQMQAALFLSSCSCCFVTLLFQFQRRENLLQGGLVLDSKKPQAVGESPVSDSGRARMLRPFHAVAAQVKEIFSGGLLATTLLLQFIWFTNALAYYGLVLLTTSVRLLRLSAA